MNIINHDEENNKGLLILTGIVLVVVIIIVITVAVLEHKHNQKKTEMIPESETIIATEEVMDTETEEEKETEPSQEIESTTAFNIKNREEFIDPIMGYFAGRANTQVQAFVKQNNLSATEAECLDCAVAQDVPSDTEFYLKLNDSAETLLTARYDPSSATVAVSYCTYTKEQIEQKVWALDNGPAERDTTETSTAGTQKVSGTVQESSEYMWTGNEQNTSGTQAKTSQNISQSTSQNTSKISSQNVTQSSNKNVTAESEEVEDTTEYYYY